MYRDSFAPGFGFRLTPWVKRLLIANFVVFVATSLVGPLWTWFAFEPRLLLLRPWTPLTYMFVHGGFWHLFFNMLGLFFFGPPIEQQWGSREFIKYYLICGLGGAALWLFFSLLVGAAPVVGASGAVFGVMLAFAMLWPNAPIYIWGIFPVPAKILVGIMALLAFWFSVQSARGMQDGVAHLAHLGGFAAGFLYIKYGDRMNRRYQSIRRRLRQPKLKVEQGGRERPRRRADEERMLDELDRVLEKISRSGLSSLTPEERHLLDEVSRSKRSN